MDEIIQKLETILKDLKKLRALDLAEVLEEYVKWKNEPPSREVDRVEIIRVQREGNETKLTPDHGEFAPPFVQYNVHYEDGGFDSLVAPMEAVNEFKEEYL